MININGKECILVEAHAHVWKEFKGSRFGDTVIEIIGNGKIRVGGKEDRLVVPDFPDCVVSIDVLKGYQEMLGIDKVLILQNPCYGDQREYLRDIVACEPNVYKTCGILDPRNFENLEREMDSLLNNYNCCGFKIEVPDVPFVMDDPQYNIMWRKIIDNNAILVLDLGWGTGPFDFNIDRLCNVIKRYPEMKLVLAHLGVSKLWDHNQVYPYPELQKTLSLLDYNKDNLYFDISAIPVFEEGYEEYPYSRGQSIIRSIKSFCGMDRIMWGSDFPGIMHHCTYQQSLNFLVKHCTFLTSEELEGILGGNAMRFIFAD